MAKKEAAADGGEAAPAGKSRLKLIIIGVVVLLLVVGISVGATWFLLGSKHGKDEKPAEEEASEQAEAKPVKKEAVYQFIAPAFVVNFTFNGRPRFMQVSVSLMGRDEKQMEALNAHMPLIRNRLVMLFSSQDFPTLMTPVGREMLRQQATATVQELATKEVGEPVIEQVLFTNFVLQ